MDKLGPGMPAELEGGQDIQFDKPAYSMGANAQGDFFADAYLLLGRMQGATVYKLGPGMPKELEGGQDIKFDEPAYSMGAGAQGDFDSPVLRLRYSSLSTPSSTIDYNMRTGQRWAPRNSSLLHVALIVCELRKQAGQPLTMLSCLDGFSQLASLYQRFIHHETL